MASALESHSEAASYAQSGYGNRMGWGSRPVLVLIDVCKAYWTPGSPLDCSAHEPTTKAPHVMRNMLAAARASRTPVVWTAVEYTDPNMKDAGLFYLKAKTLDVWNVEDRRGLGDWVDGLVPEKGEMVIKKKYASAFFGTSLATDLRVMGADTVVLCGVSTSGCVRASTLDAMQNGFRPMVSVEFHVSMSRNILTCSRWWVQAAAIAAMRFRMQTYSISMRSTRM